MQRHLHSTMVSINLSGKWSNAVTPYLDLHSTMVSINRRPGAGSEPGEAYLHSTMVSINHSHHNIPDSIHANLHSTMVSINRVFRMFYVDGMNIYIPLWYLLIEAMKAYTNKLIIFTFHYGIY